MHASHYLLLDRTGSFQLCHWPSSENSFWTCSFAKSIGSCIFHISQFYPWHWVKIRLALTYSAEVGEVSWQTYSCHLKVNYGTVLLGLRSTDVQQYPVQYKWSNLCLYSEVRVFVNTKVLNLNEHSCHIYADTESCHVSVFRNIFSVSW